MYACIMYAGMYAGRETGRHRQGDRETGRQTGRQRLRTSAGEDAEVVRILGTTGCA